MSDEERIIESTNRIEKILKQKSIIEKNIKNLKTIKYRIDEGIKFFDQQLEVSSFNPIILIDGDLETIVPMLLEKYEQQLHDLNGQILTMAGFLPDE